MAHCGDTVAGSTFNTLSMTDIATGWTVCAAFMGRGERFCVQAIEQAKALFPFDILGIDSDNAASSSMPTSGATANATTSRSPGAGPTKRTTPHTSSRRTGTSFARCSDTAASTLVSNLNCSAASTTLWRSTRTTSSPHASSSRRAGSAPESPRPTTLPRPSPKAVGPQKHTIQHQEAAALHIRWYQPRTAPAQHQ